MKKTLMLAVLLGAAAPIASAMGGQSLDFSYDNTKVSGGDDSDITFNGLRASYDLPLLPVSDGIYVSVNASGFCGWASDDVKSPYAGINTKASQIFYGGDLSFVGNMALTDNILIYTGACYSIGTFESEFDDKSLKSSKTSENLNGYGFVVGARVYLGQNLHLSVSYRQMEYKKKDDWTPKSQSISVGIGLTF